MKPSNENYVVCTKSISISVELRSASNALSNTHFPIHTLLLDVIQMDPTKSSGFHVKNILSCGYERAIMLKLYVPPRVFSTKESTSNYSFIISHLRIQNPSSKTKKVTDLFFGHQVIFITRLHV